MHQVASRLPREPAQAEPDDLFFVSLCTSLFLGFLVVLALAIR